MLFKVLPKHSLCDCDDEGDTTVINYTYPYYGGYYSYPYCESSSRSATGKERP